ncbi:DUF938 domain-containing protein [Fluctibacter halophilus]|uniref:DUF938 domain-containing protein n=1 Tax=Fluctibacter halophilus TaxID=226011 RepID=UPI001E47EFFA|nr:DUF938 domain-containing protein [Aestuariibacter halophilus]
MAGLPFSQACENNKQPILAHLQVHFADCQQVLEIGSGTGQHACHFAPALPHLVWQTSDQPHYHEGIRAWLTAYPRDNLRQPLSFTVGQDPWPAPGIDGVFSANTAHIMQPDEVNVLMQMIACHLPANGVFCQYGPFCFDGQYSSDSNRAFDQQLRSQGYGGVRDVEELQAWGAGLQLQEVLALPANNHLLVWRKP